MILNAYLEDTFSYNDITNKKLLENIALLPDPKEAIRLFSHLINCQYKWMARIMQNPEAQAMSWWEPIYSFDELEEEWSKSLALWINYIREKTEEELVNEVSFIGFDCGAWAASPKDIALQLNYHAIHHRAQIQTLLRQQGIEPDFVDYIGTRYRRIGD
jgi:uncharacterized damage-inducible protein DinB